MVLNPSDPANNAPTTEKPENQASSETRSPDGSTPQKEAAARIEAIERLTLKLPGVVPKEPVSSPRENSENGDGGAPAGASEKKAEDNTLVMAASPSEAPPTGPAVSEQTPSTDANLTPEKKLQPQALTTDSPAETAPVPPPTSPQAPATSTVVSQRSVEAVALVDKTVLQPQDSEERTASYIEKMEGFGSDSTDKSSVQTSPAGGQNSVPEQGSLASLSKGITSISMARAWRRTIWGLFLLCVISVLFKFGDHPGISKSMAYSLFGYAILSGLCLDALRRVLVSGGAARYIRSSFFDPPVIIAVLSMHWDPDLVKAMFIIRQVLTLFTSDSGSSEDSLLSTMVKRFKLNPAQVIATTFMGVIFIGTVLLMLPYSSSRDTCVGFVNALFTSTSATCVTGLVTLDTGTDFSLFGQLVIMVLFQIGGLGIMTISTAISVVLFRRITLHDQFIMGDMLDQSGGDVSRLLRYMLRYTLAIEALGALVLAFRFIPYFGDISQGLYYSVFHSISAFCNAGFSLFPDSFCRFRGEFLINGAIMSLIIIGGIGFVVIVNIHEIIKYARRGEKVRFTLHTRMVLITSIALISLGTLYFLGAEWNNAFSGLPLHEKFLASLFQSVTCRTAGFNTIDTAALSATSLLFSIVLMFIGASPGSTGGGIKTTTFAVLVLRVKAVLYGRDELEISGRTIPRIILNKSISIVMLSALICLVFLLALTWIEGKSFIHLFFETVSAFGTVGLSCGLTGKLGDPGKLLITLLMFIGRIGPLTLALALGERIIKGTFSYPEERVMVG